MEFLITPDAEKRGVESRRRVTLLGKYKLDFKGCDCLCSLFCPTLHLRARLQGLCVPPLNALFNARFHFNGRGNGERGAHTHTLLHERCPSLFTFTDCSFTNLLACMREREEERRCCISGQPLLRHSRFLKKGNKERGREFSENEGMQDFTYRMKGMKKKVIEWEEREGNRSTVTGNRQNYQ